MSVFDDVFSDQTTPNLLSLAGESITHYPAGNTGSPATVTAIVDRAEPVIANDRGRGHTYRATLHVDDGETLLKTDTWLIDSEIWTTELLGKTQDGMIAVGVLRYEAERSTSPSRVNSGR